MKNSDFIFVGWDIGGAHLKLAVLNYNSDLRLVQQFSTPIWQGLQYLEEQINWIINNILNKYDPKKLIHAVTMTAELCDFFQNREEGVSQICQLLTRLLSNQKIYFYAAEKGFVLHNDIEAVLNNLASSNWHATASNVAKIYDQGLMVDMGSTTTDIIPFKNKKLINEGTSDHQRLGSNELIYTGVVRTPVMAITDHAYYEQKKYGLMAEYFATMADVYRVLGLLNEQADQSNTADSRDKTKLDSMCRLRRMIGLDYSDTEKEQKNTIEMALYLSDIQASKITTAIQDILKKNFSEQNVIIIRAGCGVDILSKILQSLADKHVSFENMLNSSNIESYTANTCATAISVAELSRLEHAN